MRLGVGVVAFALLAMFPARSEADEALGAREIRAALGAIERRCAADLPAAATAALTSINATLAQNGGAPIETQPTTDGVLNAFTSALATTPALTESELARTVVSAVAHDIDANVDTGYMEVRACNCQAGVGLELSTTPQGHTVVEPLPGTPAEQAGIRASDVLIAVDGADASGLSLSEVVRLLRGEPESTLALTIRRASSPEPLTFTMTRAIIRVRTVTSSAEDGIGYIKIRSFTELTGRDVETALRDIRRDVRHPRGYILDLRNNSGGLLDQVIEVADLFVDGGPVLTVRSARTCPAEEPEVYNARRGDDARGAPVIVLTNANTASGAEMLALALRERRGAQIVGEATLGIGQVTTVIPLSERAVMRLITGELASPSGRSIAGGLTPDVAVAGAIGDQDPALARARALVPLLPN